MIHLQHTIRIALILAVLGLFLPAVGMADPVQEGIAAFEAEDYERAYELLKPEASEGHADAQFYVGRMYGFGFGVAQNDETGVQFIQESADQGHPQAQRTLGYLYYEGIYFEQDYEQSVRWYRKAAEAGDPSAQRSMGLSYKNGEGVEQDYAKAVKWFHRAAEQGDADSEYELGIAYYEGRGVERDLDTSVYWNRKATEAGKIHSRRLLAWHYLAGKGVEKDLERAESLYRSLLPEGEIRDRVLLANLLRVRGVEHGREKDLAEALDLYHEAGLTGYRRAMEHLGAMYFNGWGTERDPIEGMAWLMVASEAGHTPADGVLQRLRRTQHIERIRAAEARAKDLQADLAISFD